MKPKVSTFIVLLGLLSFPQISHGQSAMINNLGPVLEHHDHVSGNFGELRSGHFHSGIDYKTDEKEGSAVFAPADGFVSRAKVSSSGYGRALYLTHANNLVTVYGHLRVFYPTLEDSIQSLQLSELENEVEIFPDSTQFLVKKGDIIAFSGNSGGSEGPHLHFETRHRFSEKPFDPEILGYQIADTVPPVLKAMMLYQPGQHSGMQWRSGQIIENQINSALIEDTLFCNGQCFVGFEAYDLANNDPNKLGIKSFEVLIDGISNFNCKIDSFSFGETRMVNALIDYATYSKTGRKFVLCYKQAGNKLNFYSDSNGVFTIMDDAVHRVIVNIEDHAGNNSNMGFYIKKGPRFQIPETKPIGTLCELGKKKEIIEKNYKIQISPGSFYEDTYIQYNEVLIPSETAPMLSSVLSIGPSEIPVEEAFTLSLKAGAFEPGLESKLLIAIISKNGYLSGLNSSYNDGWLTCTSRNLGEFAVTIDTIAPVVETPFFELDELSNENKIILPVQPDLSGINSYHCFVNGKWTILSLSRINNQLIIYPENIPLQSGLLHISIEMTDKCDNRGYFEFELLLENENDK